MFKKNKKKQVEEKIIKEYDYTTWEQDFGFLVLIINRKIDIVDEYYIQMLAKQLPDKMAYIRNTDIDPQYYEVVEDVYNSLSDNYTEFLISKYFKNKEALIEFISESVYSELLKITLKTNNNKMLQIHSEKSAQKINKMNK